jgi:hypothetical protein
LPAQLLYLPPDLSKGQRKSLDEIKALLKQSVHIPSNFNGLGTQIQLFGAASTIFIGEDSVCTSNLNQLLTMIGRNKKSFQDQIALDKFLAAKFLFAIDKQVQHWLRLCKSAHNSCTQVNNRILQFKDLINTVLNGTFHMNLPPSFAKVSGQATTLSAPTENKQADGKNKGGSKDGKGQKNKKVMTEMETSSRTQRSPLSSNLLLENRGKDNFTTILPHDRPAWTNKIWMCARWHLKGDCYDNCARAVSHMMNKNIPDKKRAEILTFLSKCREEIAKKKSF